MIVDDTNKQEKHIMNEILTDENMSEELTEKLHEKASKLEHMISFALDFYMIAIIDELYKETKGISKELILSIALRPLFDAFYSHSENLYKKLEFNDNNFLDFNKYLIATLQEFILEREKKHC